MANVQALEIKVATELVPLVAQILWDHGVSAISEEELPDGRVLLRSDLPVSVSPVFHPPGSDSPTSDVSASGLSGLGVLKESLARFQHELAVVQVDDGLSNWRAYATVSRAGKRLVLWPPWIELGEVASHELVVRLEPGRAWGDGAHPTTLGCLAELERVVDHHPDRDPVTVLDLGCGSGALSVAAALLGANKVYAVDIDPAALEATKANALANQVAEKIVVSESVSNVPAVDLVVANIGVQTLTRLAETVLARLKPGGTVIMSGILYPAPAELLAAYRPLTLQKELTIEKWTCLTLA